MRKARLGCAALGGIGVLAAMCVILAAGRAARASGTEAARERWAARPFDAYRLVVEIHSGMDCIIDNQVEGEQAIYGTGNPPGCAHFRFSVSDLFALIDAFKHGQCGPNGCGCDGPIGIEVQYDETLGYPTQIEILLQPERRWQYPEFWELQLQGGSCAGAAYTGQMIRVTALWPEQ